MSFILTILFLALVIAIHEFGHFIVAKWCNIGVIEFAIGFGPLVFSRTFGETKYSLRAIPLGGFVRMVGEDISGPLEDMATGKPAAGESSRDNQEQVVEKLHPALYDKSRWFINKRVWQRAAVVFAGPFFNFASAVLISIGVLLAYGITEPSEEPVVGNLVPGYPAEKAGLKPGDRILSIDGKPIEKWIELSKTVNASEGRPLSLKIERKDPDMQTPRVFDLTLQGQPDSPEMVFMEGGDGPRGVKVGVTVAMNRSNVTFGEALLYGTVHPVNVAIMSVRGIWGLISGAVSTKNISGPIFIIGESMKSADRGMADLLEFMVFLSISLAVLNLLPVPVLDGGHLLLLGVEAIRGVPLGERASGILARTGMVALLSLMVFAISNDIGKLLGIGN